jgi:photosystem II stability/assembly factor-like uncharacterized protein
MAMSPSFVRRLCLTVMIGALALQWRPGLCEEPARAKALSVIHTETTHDALYDLEAEGQSMVAVGAHGSVLASSDGGKSWSRNSLPTDLALLGVALVAGRGVVVGQSGLAYRSDDQSQWTPVVTGTTNRLFRVDMTRTGTVIAVGAFGTIVVSTDFGKTWSQVTLDWARYVQDGFEPHLYEVRALPDGSFLVGGEFGTMLRSVDGGITWALVNSGDESIFAMSFLPDGRGIAVGQNGRVIMTKDSGATWRIVDSPTNGNLAGVWIDQTGKAVAVGVRTMLRSRDFGASWSAESGQEVTRSWFQGIRGAADGTVVVVGQSGTIARLL